MSEIPHDMAHSPLYPTGDDAGAGGEMKPPLSVGDAPRSAFLDACVANVGTLTGYDLTPAQALDYLAVVVVGRDLERWAWLRDVDEAEIHENVDAARTRLAEVRIGASVTEDDEAVIVTVPGVDGEAHDVRFPTHLDDAELTCVYECLGSIHGHYVEPDGTELESTEWYDGRIAGSFQTFDFNDDWGTPQAKADVILWSREVPDRWGIQADPQHRPPAPGRGLPDEPFPRRSPGSGGPR